MLVRSVFRVYVVFSLMQRYIEQHNEVELSALGMGKCFRHHFSVSFSSVRTNVYVLA